MKTRTVELDVGNGLVCSEVSSITGGVEDVVGVSSAVDLVSDISSQGPGNGEPGEVGSHHHQSTATVIVCWLVRHRAATVSVCWLARHRTQGHSTQQGRWVAKVSRCTRPSA